MAEENQETIGGPSSADERGRAPVKRERKDRMKTKSKDEAGDSKAQDKLQKAAAQRTTDQQTEEVARNQRLLISSKLQTADHVGKHPAEPHKHKEVEDAKVGLAGTETAPGDNIEVETIDQEVDGVHVDTIVTNPPPPGGVVGGAVPLSEGQRVQKAIDDAKTKKK